jgi:FMN phosphatase YigB (HAD superfamily)
LGARPSEVVHIGDDLRSDALGAKNAGFRTILLSTEVGRDMMAERDPTSLVSITREFGRGLRVDEVAPDRTIASLEMAIDAIRHLDDG